MVGGGGGIKVEGQIKVKVKSQIKDKVQIKNDNRVWARPVPSGKWRGSASWVSFRRAAGGFVCGAVRLPLGHGGCVLGYQTAPPE